MAFLKPQPTNFRERIAAISRTEWLFGLAAVALTLIVMTGFLVESRWGYEALSRPRVIYFESWPSSGSLASIDAAAPRPAAAAEDEPAAPAPAPQ